MKIVLITSGQPSLNPRLVKEADALIEAGYDVNILYQYWNDWATGLDKKLLSKKNWKIELVGGDPQKEKFNYLKSRILYKASRKISQIVGFKANLGEGSIGRCTNLLIKKACQIPANLYIAHNLAALPAAVLAAKKNNAKCGFDAEDFHRNEVSNDPNNFDVKLKTYIETKYLLDLDYLTTSSPLISEGYQHLYPFLKANTLLNVFHKQAVKNRNRSDKKLKLFWFSQTIGPNRGIEAVIKAIGAANNPNIELHLLGNCNDKVKTSLTQLAEASGLGKMTLFFYKPIPSDDIFNFASKFDIGLATEIGSPQNRDICLTNKIFTYIQSGLAVIASDTTAQKKLLATYPNMGSIYNKNDSESLSYTIKTYFESRELLLNHQNQAYLYATEILNWNIEKLKFLEIIKSTLNT